MQTNVPFSRPATRIRWAARLASVAIIAWWMLISYLHIASGDYSPGSSFLLGPVWLACLGLLVAWRRERMGGRIAVAASLLLAAFTIYRHIMPWNANAPMDGLPLALELTATVAFPFLLAGLLFLMADRRCR